MKNQDLRDRTKRFSLDIVRFVQDLPKDRTADPIARQLVRSGTSVGANYRAACRARSTPDFISKIGVVEEEADECGFWLEILQDSGIRAGEETMRLLKEADELTAIFVAGGKTAKESLL